MQTLDSLVFYRNRKVIVETITATGEDLNRFFDMGIHPGSQLSFVKTAPFGDPIEITLNGFHLFLRKKEARSVMVNFLDGGER